MNQDFVTVSGVVISSWLLIFSWLYSIFSSLSERFCDDIQSNVSMGKLVYISSRGFVFENNDDTLHYIGTTIHVECHEGFIPMFIEPVRCVNNFTSHEAVPYWKGSITTCGNVLLFVYIQLHYSQSSFNMLTCGGYGFGVVISCAILSLSKLCSHSCRMSSGRYGVFTWFNICSTTTRAGPPAWYQRITSVLPCWYGRCRHMWHKHSTTGQLCENL